MEPTLGLGPLVVEKLGPWKMMLPFLVGLLLQEVAAAAPSPGPETFSCGGARVLARLHHAWLEGFAFRLAVLEWFVVESW